MTQVFSDYLRSLSPAGEPPGPRVFQDLWRALRELLRRELRRRGLWESSPSFLGVDGWSRWEEVGSSEADALDELVAGCYTYVFLERLTSLRAQLRVKTEVEGLVVRSVRNFLHDTQKRRDPLGYRVYVVLRAALETCLERGRLEIAQGGPKIANDTVFSFVKGATTAEESRLRELVPPWNDELLPELVTGRGDTEKQARERLAELVLALPAQGVEAFVFRHVIDPLKFDVRARWAALLAADVGDGESDDEPGELVRLVRAIGPDASFEERESFERLVDCVSAGLERLQNELRQKTHRYLLSLWQFLRVFATEGGVLRAGSLPEAAAEPSPAAETPELPSQRQLAQLLGIPRERLPELFSLLAGVVARCLPPSAADPALSNGWRARSVPQKGSVMALRDLQDKLRLQTAEVVRREMARESEGEPAGPPRVGEVFALPASADVGVEWVLVASAPGRTPRFLALAADTLALRGSADVGVPVTAGAGPLTLRCRCSAWLDAEQLAHGVRTGTLGEEVLARADEKRAALAAGRQGGTAIERETDADPEYQDWLEELGALAARLGTAEPRPGAVPGAVAAPRRQPMRWTSLNDPWARAASILLVVGLGLGGGLWREQARRGALETRLAQSESERRLEQERHAAQLDELQVQIAELKSRPPSSGGERLFNVVSVSLDAVEAVRGDSERIMLAPEATGVFIEVLLPPDRPDDRYDIELFELASREKRRLEGPALVDTEGTGVVSLVLLRSELRPGRWVLSLVRADEPAGKPVASYGLEIVFEK